MHVSRDAPRHVWAFDTAAGVVQPPAGMTHNSCSCLPSTKPAGRPTGRRWTLGVVSTYSQRTVLHTCGVIFTYGLVIVLHAHIILHTEMPFAAAGGDQQATGPGLATTRRRTPGRSPPTGSTGGTCTATSRLGRYRAAGRSTRLTASLCGMWAHGMSTECTPHPPTSRGPSATHSSGTPSLLVTWRSTARSNPGCL